VSPRTSSRRRSRGVSTLLASFTISMAVLIVISYLAVQVAVSALRSSGAIGSVVRYVQAYERSNLVFSIGPDAVTISNLGPKDVVIDRIVVYDLSSNRVVALDPLELCSSRVVEVYREISCRAAGYEYLALITAEGVVVYPQVAVPKPTYVPEATYILTVVFSISNPEELSAEFDAPPELVSKPYTRQFPGVIRGIRSDKLLLLPPGREYECYNELAQTDSEGLAFGVLVVGYDPSWIKERELNPSTSSPPRFTIMIAGPAFTGQEKIWICGRSINLAGNGFRILINNFTGVIRILKGGTTVACSASNPADCSGVSLPAIGFWYYGTTDRELNLRVFLSGTAGYVARFLRMASGNSPTGESSYYPYLFVGDVDGNGVADLVFITEDAYYGDWSRINDYYGNDDLSDWSTEPLVLKLLSIGRGLGSRDGSVDGSKYSGLLLYLNVFFHDNSHPDEQQLEDVDVTDWVLRVLLIDEQNNTYVIREYRYQEICNYHKTRIAAFGLDNYFVKISQSIYIPLPTGGRYWVAIAFQDPYKTGPRNDADIAVGVELIGVLPFYR